MTHESIAPPPAPELSRKRRVFLVEDHAVVRDGLTRLINHEHDLEVCGESADLAHAVPGIEQTSPDVVIVDLLLGDDDGLELIRTLKDQRPDLPTLVLSMYKESLYAERALRAGARGYVTKQAPTETVLSALRRVLCGTIYVSEAMASALVSKLVAGESAPRTPGDVSRLSDREFEVFTLIGRGVGPGEIAERLGLSVKTVESHRENIKDKLHLPNGRELLRKAMEHVAATGDLQPRA
jgi:DNA-binding NarL/FixJ family response regulator